MTTTQTLTVAATDEQDWAGSEATRYLCVGAYLDPQFRRAVLREVLDAEHRAVAPSYGIDIVPVLRHCIRARRRELVRNVVFAVLLVAFVLVDAPAVVSGLVLAQTVSLYVRAWRAFTAGHYRQAIIRLLVGLLLLSLVSGLVQVLLTVAGADGQTDTEGELTVSAVAFLLLVLAAWAVRLAELLVNHHTVLTELSPGRFDPAAAPAEPPRHTRRIAYLAQAQKGNVTYYSRTVAERPFVGSGFRQDAWQLAIPLRRAAGVQPPAESLTVRTLYRRMRQALIPLADPETPAEQRITGLSMQSRLFVPGLLRRQDGLLDPESQLPRHFLPRAEMDRFEQHDRNRATEYLTIRIGAWEGELEITVLLYFSIRGGSLYTEFVGASLPSVRELYHDADSYQQLQPAVYLRLALTALGRLPMLLLRSPLEVLIAAWDWFLEQVVFHGENQQIYNRLAFDYGVRASVRELGADEAADQFFQNADGNRYIGLVERRVRDAVVEVLREFGYSTEEFIERTTTIINNSTQISGGTFNASAISVGASSHATSTTDSGSGGGS